VVAGAGGAKVYERQVVKVEVAARVDSELRVAAAAAACGLAFLGRRRRHPLERLAAIFGVPDPARVRREGAGHAQVNAVRVRRVEPDVLLEADALDTADRGLPEGGRGLSKQGNGQR